MKESLEKYPQRVFFDETYRVNIENYALWATLVMDKDGIGQPVAFGYLSDEQDATMQKFFHLFRVDNPGAMDAEVMYVDKVKGNIRILDEEYPTVPSLICAFHAMKAFKTRLSLPALHIVKKHEVLQLFSSVLYSGTADELEKTRKSSKQKRQRMPLRITKKAGKV